MGEEPFTALRADKLVFPASPARVVLTASPAPDIGDWVHVRGYPGGVDHRLDAGIRVSVDLGSSEPEHAVAGLGEVSVSDRVFSSLAFQQMGQAVSLDEDRGLEEFDVYDVSAELAALRGE